MSHTSGAAAVAPVSGSNSAGTSGGSEEGVVTGTVSTSTTISSLSDLKTKAPKIYNMMVTSIGMDMCNQMQRSQDRLKQMWSGNGS